MPFLIAIYLLTLELYSCPYRLFWTLAQRFIYHFTKERIKYDQLWAFWTWYVGYWCGFMGTCFSRLVTISQIHKPEREKNRTLVLWIFTQQFASALESKIPNATLVIQTWYDRRTIHSLARPSLHRLSEIMQLTCYCTVDENGRPKLVFEREAIEILWSGFRDA